MGSFHIRNATINDLDAIMRVEEAWPQEQRANPDKFVARLERFPEGFFLTEVENRVVAASTSTLVNYDPSNLASFQSWEQCTNNGYLFPIEADKDYNAIFMVSNGIMKEYRRIGIREGVIKSVFKLAADMDMNYTVTGAMMPGYDAYCRQNGEIPISDYAFMKRNGELIDPTLRKLATLDFILPDQRHIIENYYSSPGSRNYGALLVHSTFADDIKD